MTRSSARRGGALVAATLVLAGSTLAGAPPPVPVDGVPVGTALNGAPAVPDGRISHEEILASIGDLGGGSVTADPTKGEKLPAPAWLGGEDHHHEDFHLFGSEGRRGEGVDMGAADPNKGHIKNDKGQILLNTAGEVHPNFPLIALKKKRQIRTWPGLQKMLALQQAGNVQESLEVLDETLGQVDQVQRQEGGLKEGKQCQATRGIQQLARTMGNPLSEEEEETVQTATESASRKSSPLLLDLNGNGLADVTTPDPVDEKGPFVRAGATRFDITGLGSGELTEWLVPHADGLLAHDANGNGRVDSVVELFGDADGFLDGYAKLAVLDRDGDGAVAGAEIAGLSVWIDDGDGIGEAGELHAVADLGIESISVVHDGYRSTFVRNGKEERSWDWFPRTFFHVE